MPLVPDSTYVILDGHGAILVGMAKPVLPIQAITFDLGGFEMQLGKVFVRAIADDQNRLRARR